MINIGYISYIVCVIYTMFVVLVSTRCSSWPILLVWSVCATAVASIVSLVWSVLSVCPFERILIGPARVNYNFFKNNCNSPLRPTKAYLASASGQKTRLFAFLITIVVFAPTEEADFSLVLRWFCAVFVWRLLGRGSADDSGELDYPIFDLVGLFVLWWCFCSVFLFQPIFECLSEILAGWRFFLQMFGVFSKDREPRLKM